MLREPLSTGAIRQILLAFLVMGSAGAGGLSEGCSSGERGLVLGDLLFQQGGTGVSAGTGGTEAGGTEAGGSSPLVVGGDAGSAGEAGTGSSVPPWVIDACSPTLSFINKDTTAQGQLFTDAVPSPSKALWEAAHDACRLLFHEASEVKPVPKISLVVEDTDGVAYSSGGTIHLSTRYLKAQADRGTDLAQEIAGILHFSTSVIYQNGGSDADSAPPSWLVVGIADYVRLESGYIDRAERARGGAYDGGSSQTTAFFLDYLSTKNPDLVYELNQQLAPSAPVWSNDVFVTLLGSDVDTLWARYQATL
jgi:Peptidase of plants and bacteria